MLSQDPLPLAMCEEFTDEICTPAPDDTAYPIFLTPNCEANISNPIDNSQTDPQSMEMDSTLEHLLDLRLSPKEELCSKEDEGIYYVYVESSLIGRLEPQEFGYDPPPLGEF